jgi:S-DNA-T family DNA segregation ATPase FtsK/SpoIIIE
MNRLVLKAAGERVAAREASKVTDTDRRLQTLRSCALITALVFCAFGWIALLTFDPADWPNSSVWPQPDPVHNACGRVGAWLTFHLSYYFGRGAYSLLVCLTVACLVKLARRAIGQLPLRLIGLTLVITVTAAVAALMYPRPSEGLVEGPGGVLGLAVAALVTDYFSTIGAALVLTAATIVGLLLLADDVLFRTPWLAAAVWRFLGRVLTRVRSAGLPRPALTPVNMGAGNMALSCGSPATVLQGRQADEPTVDYDADEEDDQDPMGQMTAAPAPEAADQPNGAADPESSDGAEEADDLDEIEENDLGEEPMTPPERQLIIRMLGRDPLESKPPKSAWPKELGDYVLPPLSLLRDPEVQYSAAQEDVVREQAAILERTLADFRIEVRVVEIDTGPVITMFELELSAGTKVSQINSLANDIARALKAPAVRVVAPIPGKNTIGIEVPNLNKEKVRLKELIMLGGVKPTRMALPVFIGKNASGDPLIVDLTTMPHLLIAGTTGSGKSVAINGLVMSILMTQRPDHVKLILVDPKMVELSVFKEIPHLMCPIVTDMQQAELILEWATTKMDERYELLAEAAVKDVASYNRLGKEEIYHRFQPTTEQEKMQIPTHLPYIVILIDELADLMMTSGKEVEQHLSRLAQKSRAVGVHLVVATQRPQANVVTGLVKSNLPCRMAFRVASRMDSRIVLDQNGAEVLLGEGDMLLLPPGSSKLVRAQGTYVEEDELRAILGDLSQKAKPEFHHELQRLRPSSNETEGARDPLFDKAVDILVETQRGSVSLLQRRLEIGYSRASRLVDQMAAAGIVGEYKGSQAREVLLNKQEWAQIREQRDRDLNEGGYRADLDAEDDDVYGMGESSSASEVAEPD